MSKPNILGICGSASKLSSNFELLKTLSIKFDDKFDWILTNELREFPLFRPEDLEKETPELIQKFKIQIKKADAIIIVAPEYTHNIPAVLKNALEWLTASGEFANKPLLPITFTPAPPRGKYAMQSLLESLKTMDAKVITQLSLYKSDVKFDDYEISLSEEIETMLQEAMNLFTN
jgi:NAD(P)H-dependent FMN reductase